MKLLELNDTGRLDLSCVRKSNTDTVVYIHAEMELIVMGQYRDNRAILSYTAKWDGTCYNLSEPIFDHEYMKENGFSVGDIEDLDEYEEYIYGTIMEYFNPTKPYRSSPLDDKFFLITFANIDYSTGKQSDLTVRVLGESFVDGYDSVEERHYEGEDGKNGWKLLINEAPARQIGLTSKWVCAKVTVYEDGQAVVQNYVADTIISGRLILAPRVSLTEWEHRDNDIGIIIADVRMDPNQEPIPPKL